MEQSNARRLDDDSAASILADSRLVEVRPDGTRVFYSPTLARIFERTRQRFGEIEPDVREPELHPRLVDG